MNLVSQDGKTPGAVDGKGPVDGKGAVDGKGRWDFLTNHSHVLVCVSRDPGIRLRDIASSVGITERTAHRILSELVEAGYVERERNGRRNIYTVEPGRPLRHPLVEERGIGDLLAVLHEPAPSTKG